MCADNGLMFSLLDKSKTGVLACYFMNGMMMNCLSKKVSTARLLYLHGA